MKLIKHIKVIPLITMFLGIGFAAYMFYNVTISPLLNTEKLFLNETYEITVSKEFVITIFIDEEFVDDIHVEDYANFKKVTYTVAELDYEVLLNVLSDTTSNDGYVVTSTHEETSYDIESLHGIFQIRFKEPGLYYFGLLTYDDQGTDFHMISTNVPEAKRDLFVSASIGGLSFIGSLVSLYFLLKNPKKDD